MQKTFRAATFNRALFIAISCIMAAFLLLAMVPQPSQAMEVTSCTARSNSSASNEVMGGMETRITWEAQLGDGEQLSSLTIDYPDGFNVPADKVKVTGLSGLDRIDLGETVASVDENTISIGFSTPTQAGLLIRVEANNTMLPNEEGDYAPTATATLADGTVQQLDQAPTFHITSVLWNEQASNELAEQGWVQAWNSNKFLHMFLDPTIAVVALPTVFYGWLQALLMVVASFPIAIVWGLILCFMRICKIKVLRGIGSLYVNVVRGTPLFLQIYIAFFGLPLVGIVVGDYMLSVIVMSLNSGAYLCEIFRAGIESIQKGQFEAARSLGMNSIQTMFFVIIPQAFRRVIPTMTSEFILLYKDTSLFAAVGVMEMIMYARSVVSTTGNMTPYIVAAIFYLIVTLPLTKMIGTVERRLGHPQDPGSKKSRFHNIFGRKVEPKKEEEGLRVASDSEHVRVTDSPEDNTETVSASVKTAVASASATRAADALGGSAASSASSAATAPGGSGGAVMDFEARTRRIEAGLNPEGLGSEE